MVKKTSRSHVDDFRKDTKTAQIAIGGHLKKLREDRGFYLHEVVRKLKPPVWPQTLAKWESGEIGVSVARLVELAKIYGVELGEIVE